MENREIYQQEEYHDEYEQEEGGFVSHESMPWWIRKSPSVLISTAFHALILIVTVFMTHHVIKTENKNEKILMENRFKPKKYNPEAEKDIRQRDPLPTENISDITYRPLEEEVKPVVDIPRGTSLENMSNKNLNSTSCVDAVGLGGGASGAYGERNGRGAMFKEYGGPPTEFSVYAALRWLHFHQDKDGKWNVDGFTKNCTQGHCGGEGEGKKFDVGVTGLALLAYLGNGQTHRVGEFRKTVRRALRFVKSSQDADGCFGPREGESWFYNHAICLMAMCEAYAMTYDKAMKRIAEKGLKFGLEARNPGLGWKYEPRGGKNDTSVTGWMVLALKAAKTGGLPVPKEAFTDARAWFDKVTAANGRTGYERPGDLGSKLRGQTKNFDRQETMTAVALICRIFTGQSRKDPVIKKGADLLMNKLPTYDKPNHNKVNYYYWYNATYAMFQIGGKKWEKWNQAMKTALLESQRSGGCPDGSWDPVGEWCIVGGRAYATAINALTLEIYYRYAKVKESKGAIASRK